MTKSGPSRDCPTEPQVLTEAEVLVEERRRLLPGKLCSEPLAALCLSGGGIRSATFALGVIEALARFGLLGQFHYLSTVSGGGYIGSWLTAWRTREGNDGNVFTALDRFKSANGEEAPQVQGLRFNSNYLTPKLGLLSADTWAAVALILRNLVLNWLVFGPLFMGALFLPKFGASALLLLGPQSGSTPIPWLLIAAASAVGGLAVAVRSRMQASGNWLSDGGFLLLVAVPLIVAAVATTFGAGAWLRAPLIPSAEIGAAAGGVCFGLAWCAGFVWWTKAVTLEDRKPAALVWYGDLPAFVAAGLVAGSLLGSGLHLRTLLPQGSHALLVFGPAWVLLSFALADVVFVGLNSFAARGDQDREWLARYGGWLLAFAGTFCAVCAVDLYMPFAIRWTWGRATVYLASLGLSGAVTLLLGPSRLTGATASRKAIEPFKLSNVVSLAALVFAACLAGAISVLDDELTCLIAGGVVRSGLSACALLDQGRAAPYQFAGFLAFVLFAFVASYFVNVNRFSLHALYRNRLVRAFLGSARRGFVPDRHPDPFSGFDQDDNLRMHAARPPAGPDGERLLQVLNMTLNVVATDNLAWQERKAESFTVTALHAGSPKVGYRPTKYYGDPHGGITLGTAMAISGAAVSPNSGYHSSPLVGMLLSLFNLRLGWWLGNPSCGTFYRDGPVPGVLPALEELAGQTNDSGKWVYMSDGGHFENLGLYEMVRRGCRRVVISDAGCDPSSAFEDLGNAARKVYIDFGVSIDFKTLNIPPRKTPPEPGFYCAIGTIHYPKDDGVGWLLYLKPGYRGVEPIHVRSYAAANTTFPHESTADQWFTESQFEAYRALGAYITEIVCTGGQGLGPREKAKKMDLDNLIIQASRYLDSKPTAG